MGHDHPMRSHFFPSRPDAAEFVRSATIVLDTNVLLGMYRLSPAARDDAFVALESVANRLWLPHQVGVEFYRRVDEVRDSLDEAYGALRAEVDKLRNFPGTAFGAQRRFQTSRTAVNEVIQRSIKTLLGKLDKLAENDDARVDPDHDDVLTRIEVLFENRVGDAPSAEVHRERIDDFFRYRLPNSIPPGYEDGGKPGPPSRAAGDYLLWCEVLDHVDHTDDSVLLITDDQKQDWYQIGDHFGPRTELVVEFRQRSSGGYHQMPLAGFVRTAKSALGAKVDEVSADEIDAASQDAASEAEAVQRLRKEVYEAQRSVPVYDDIFRAAMGPSALAGVPFSLSAETRRIFEQMPSSLFAGERLLPEPPSLSGRGFGTGSRGVVGDARPASEAGASAHPDENLGSEATDGNVPRGDTGERPDDEPGASEV